MPELKKTLQSKMKIRFHDCDPFHHLNNSRYIDYIVTARGDQLLENYGFDIYELARKEGIGWVAAQTQISYMHPAFIAEEVLIATQLIGFSTKSLLLEAFMWDAHQSVLKAVMWTKLVHFDLVLQKSKAHSQELLQFFESIVKPLADASCFEARVKSLRS